MKTAAKNDYGFVGSCLAMDKVYDRIGRVAASSAPVFVHGETGTGKELCAHAIHAKSARSKQPFVAINCGAIPHDLLESEMFGHLKGSFTGAIANRDGAAKQADGGTLFLDEVCELPLELQTKLLRFLQDGWIRPVGAGRPQRVDVRIICATNKDPKAEVEAGRFRQDLFYRLFVLHVSLPPLRLRGADITLLANYFLTIDAQKENKHFEGFSPEALFCIEDYDWPGNVRELQNVIRHCVVMHDGPQIERAMLAELIDHDETQPKLDVTAFTGLRDDPARPRQFRARQLWQIERDAIEAAIVASNGSVPKAAEQLGVSPSTIYRKRESWGLQA